MPHPRAPKESAGNHEIRANLIHKLWEGQAHRARTSESIRTWTIGQRKIRACCRTGATLLRIECEKSDTSIGLRTGSLSAVQESRSVSGYIMKRSVRW